MTNTSIYDFAQGEDSGSPEATTPSNSSTDDDIRPTEGMISPSSFGTRYKVKSLLDLWPWNLWSLVASAIAILLLLGLSMTAVFVSTGERFESANPDSSSTPIEMVERYYSFRAAVSNYSKPFAFDEYTSAQSRALDWMTWKDTTVASDDIERLLQRYAVMVLFFACNGENWRGYEIALDKEGDTMECNFRGFTCDATGLLTSINLADTGLLGTLPPEIGLLSPGLTSLYLNLNHLEGSIPEVVMDKLTNLEHLNLASNKLTSSISPQISRLSHLKNLTLSYNQLTGTLPSSMMNMTSLEDFQLDHTDVSGPIFDFLPSWTNLARLRAIETALTGEIPRSIGANTKLQRLRLEETLIHGSIPSEIGLLTHLVVMAFGSCMLEGTIPTEIGLLTNLVELEFADTNIEGSIPSTIINMIALQIVSLAFNPKLTGTIPAGLMTLADLKFIHLEQSSLSGTLPPLEIANSRLSALSLMSTNLEGTIPEVYCHVGVAIRYPCGMSCSCCERGCDGN